MSYEVRHPNHSVSRLKHPQTSHVLSLLHEGCIDTPLENGGGDQVHELTLAQVHVHVCCRGQFEPLCSLELHLDC